MNTRNIRKGRRALVAVALTAGIALSVTGCGDGGTDEGSEAKPSASSGKGSSEESQPDASASPAQEETTVESNGISLTVSSAVRDSGGFLTLTGRVTNNTSGLWVAAEWASDESELKKNASSMAGASLVDPQGRKKFLVLRDTQGRCLCTKFTGGLDEGDSADWFAQFPAPAEGTSEVQLQLPTMPPATVKITEGE